MALNAVKISGVDTSALPVLSDEEKDRLLKRIKEGDKEARTAYAEGNLRLVIMVVRRFSKYGQDMDELFQIGCVGLMKAVDRFDLSFGGSFSTYAVPMITGEILRYLRDDVCPVHIPRTLKQIGCRAANMKAADGLSLKEIASRMNVPEETVSEAVAAIKSPASLYESFSTDKGDEFCLMDTVADYKNRDDKWVLSIDINKAMERLNDREYKVIWMHFFEGRTQAEIGSVLGVAQNQVSRIEKKALFKMWQYFTA